MPLNNGDLRRQKSGSILHYRSTDKLEFCKTLSTGIACLFLSKYQLWGWARSFLSSTLTTHKSSSAAAKLQPLSFASQEVSPGDLKLMGAFDNQICSAALETQICSWPKYTLTKTGGFYMCMWHITACRRVVEKPSASQCIDLGFWQALALSHTEMHAVSAPRNAALLTLALLQEWNGPLGPANLPVPALIFPLCSQVHTFLQALGYDAVYNLCTGHLCCWTGISNNC